MPPAYDIERDGKKPMVILSMRTKASVVGLCFLLLLGLVAYLDAPHFARAVRGLAQGGSLVENESQPPEQEAPELLEDEPQAENESPSSEEESPLGQTPSSLAGLSSEVGWRSEIVISADGCIDSGGGTPWQPAAPIYRDGDIYILLGDILYCTIRVLKDDIVIDGEGYTVKGPRADYRMQRGNGIVPSSEGNTGIRVESDNVTIRDLTVTGFRTGIYASDGKFLLANNRISDNDRGIIIDVWTQPPTSLLVGNTVSCNREGISMSGNFTLIANTISHNSETGIFIHWFDGSSTDRIVYGNSFINNTQ